jgi:dipeptidyl aminopeptidase/acylaminoacyl peptidase
VVRYDIASGREDDIAGSDALDSGEVVTEPTRHLVEAVAFYPDRKRWVAVNPAVKPDLAALAKVSHGDLSLISADLADRTWIVAFNSDRGPVYNYKWDRVHQRATFLFAHQSALEKVTLAAMMPITFNARDGTAIHGYLTLPVGLAPSNLPLVLFVHGGPWGRDKWGYNGDVQLLANRGYAVLQINFRGSGGYGRNSSTRAIINAGLKMEDDLIDGLNWVVKQGIADPNKVAIYGGSYGGYAALAGAAFDPDTFRCAIDEFGPSNLFPLFAAMPSWWHTEVQNVFYLRVGNPDKPEDRIYLTKASPAFSAAKIRIPMLIAQGANDARVKPEESEQIVAALERHGQHVTYVVYTDEGHGFARPENQLDFQARAEKFLADNLGGRYEPMRGTRIPGSTAIVKVVGN